LKKAVMLGDALDAEADEAAAAGVFFCFFVGEVCVAAALLANVGAGTLRFVAALDESASSTSMW
jgi:hypothetical protein